MSLNELNEDRLFIAHREKGIGIITETEIRRTQNNGRKYIYLKVSFGGGDDDVPCVMGKIDYTAYVIAHGLEELEEAEEENVASLVGKQAQVRYEHVRHVNGQAYCTIRMYGIVQ